jgi:hypothetical protein
MVDICCEGNAVVRGTPAFLMVLINYDAVETYTKTYQKSTLFIKTGVNSGVHWTKCRKIFLEFGPGVISGVHVTPEKLARAELVSGFYQLFPG